jgi:hypothetical protein
MLNRRSGQLPDRHPRRGITASTAP